MGEKPTIAELEAILSAEGQGSIEILPNGEICAAANSGDAEETRAALLALSDKLSAKAEQGPPGEGHSDDFVDGYSAGMETAAKIVSEAISFGNQE